MPELAPIALFAFKRPAHTLRTLEALSRNPEFARSPLHIFCDGARRPNEEDLVAQTRAVARDWPHTNKVVVEAPTNQGLARSIIDGVSGLCEVFGRVIVVEDDLVVAPVFLDFMNRALDRYARDNGVMQVSGFMFPVELPGGRDTLFLPFTTSWGWATWHRAWMSFDSAMTSFDRLLADRGMRKRFDLDDAFPYFQMLQKQRAGLVDSWAIRWYLSVFMVGGTVLYPARSLVRNDGFDGSGTHGADHDSIAIAELPEQRLVIDAASTVVDQSALRVVARYLYGTRGVWRKLRDWFQRLVSA